MDIMEVIKTRRSIRRFKQDPVPEDKVLKILEAANVAPSAGNLQPWRFIVLHRSVLDRLEGILGKSFDERFKDFTEEAIRLRLKDLPIPTDESKDKIKGLKSFYRSLGKAPIAIVAYAERPEDPWAFKNTIEDVSAAFQNMILAAWEEGLGTCWMTGPLHRGAEAIKRFLGLPENQEIIAITPLGVPDEIPASPPKEDIKSKVKWMGFESR